jgi:hypothetical protein
MWYLLPVIATGRRTREPAAGCLRFSRVSCCQPKHFWVLLKDGWGKLSPLWRRRQQSIALSHRVYSRHEGKERIDQKRFIIIGGNKFLPPFDPLSNIIRTCFSFFFIFFFFFFFFFFSVIFVCVSILFDLIVSVGAVWVLHTCPAHRPTQAIT